MSNQATILLVGLLCTCGTNADNASECRTWRDVNINDSMVAWATHHEVSGFHPMNVISSIAGPHRSKQNGIFNNTILVTTGNQAYGALADQWEKHASSLGYKWLFVALDDLTLFQREPFLCTAHIDYLLTGRYFFQEDSKERIYGNVNFNTLTANKLRIVLALLERGYDVVFSDPDNFILQDIFDEGSELHSLVKSGYDYIYSVDRSGNPKLSTLQREDIMNACKTKEEPYGNTGFYFARGGSKVVRNMFQNSIEMTSLYGKYDDQSAFWRVLSQNANRRHCNKEQDHAAVGNAEVLRFCCLDPRKFVAGRENPIANKHDLMTYHANWVWGIQNKITKLKRNGIWDVLK